MICQKAVCFYMLIGSVCFLANPKKMNEYEVYYQKSANVFIIGCNGGM